MRIIIFSGTGGSGVTTLAAATAVAAARGRAQTLIYGLNPGAGQALDTVAGAEAARVSDGLWMIEGQRSSAPDEFRDWLEMLLDWRGMDVELADDLAALPGMNHVGRLLELESYIDSGDYDAVILDAAPLAQFLDLPPALDSSARWLERLFAPRQANVFEPFLRVFAGDYASAGEDVLERGRGLLGRLAALRARIEDTTVTTVRLVLAPSMGAAATARHAVTALGLFSCPVDAVVVNQVLPEEVTDPFFEPLIVGQRTAVNELRGAVSPIPVLEMPLHPHHVPGDGTLAGVAEAVYGETEPLSILHSAGEKKFTRNGGEYVMIVPLPLAVKEELDLEETDSGVAVHLDGRRCVIALPEGARNYDRASWSLEDGMLKVVFER